MKKIKTINKLLSSLTLLSPLTSVGFNNQYQNTQIVITESSNNSLINYVANQTNEQKQMGDITVTVEGTTITGFVSSSGEGKLIVDSDITKIGSNAFANCTDITSLDLSQATSLTTIGDYAFNYCYNLTGDLVIPSSVTSIGDSAFSHTRFTSLDLSNATSLTTIEQCAFEDCENLTGDLMIPSSVTNIGETAFGNCYNINSLDLSQATSLKDIGQGSFEICANLTGNLVIPSSVTNIGSSAFFQTRITSLDLSNATSLTTINYNSFETCTNLTGDLVIPSSVTLIGSYAFSGDVFDNLYFLSETPPTFDSIWQPTVTGKVYVSSEAAKQAYLSAENFSFNEDQIEIGLPPEPTPKKSNTGLILGLVFWFRHSNISNCWIWNLIFY